MKTDRVLTMIKIFKVMRIATKKAAFQARLNLLFFLVWFQLPLLAQNFSDTLETGKYLDSLYQRTKSFSIQGKIKEGRAAADLGVSAVSEFADIFPARHANALDIRASFYLSSRESLVKAEADFLQARDIRFTKLGSRHPDLARSENNLGSLKRLLGQYKIADSLFARAAKIWADTFGTNHIWYATAINNRASTLHGMGHYKEAYPYYQEAKQIRYQLDSLRDYAASLSDMGVYYLDIGQWERADSFFTAALDLRLQKLGKKHPDYAATLNNLASLCSRRGQFKKALRHYEEAGAIWAETEGENSLLYSFYLGNKGLVLYRLGELDSAVTCLSESKRLRGGGSPQRFATTLVNLGRVFIKMCDYDRAMLELEEAVNLLKSDTTRPEYPAALQNLAFVCGKKGQSERADQLYHEVLRLRQRYISTNLPEYAQVMMLYADFNRSKGANELADSLYWKASIALRKHLVSTAKYATEEELLAYIELHQPEWDFFFDLAAQKRTDANTMVAYDNVLLFRNASLQNLINIASIRDASNATKKTFEDWQAKRRIVGEQIFRAKPADLLKNANDDAENLEELLMRTVSIANVQKEITWQDVRNRLKHDEAAIEFVAYHPYNSTLQTSEKSVNYAALILRSGDSAPIFLPLFEESVLTKIVGGNPIEVEADVNTFYNESDLYNVLWKPIERYLQKVSVIYLVPDGELHKISFEAIINPKTAMPLAEQYLLVRLGSSRQIAVPDLQSSQKTNASPTAIIYGGINYEADCDSFPENISKDYKEESKVRSNVQIESEGFPILNFTAHEADAISEMLRKKKYRSTVLKSYFASESHFKQMEVPTILHIGTHGFFYKRNVEDKSLLPFKVNESSMIRSGLAMAGANKTWKNTSICPKSDEDGILTAYEVSQKYLLGTDLVVLSACKTGLGDVVGGEGIYGLQRAFKIAGAKHIVMSLWEVADHTATEDFLTKFYENWLDKDMDIRQAFRSAQMEIRETWASPYYWACFVLIE
jgi:CHAT domain-containing protein/tetratricopeptide (TPR) repeat protein